MGNIPNRRLLLVWLGALVVAPLVVSGVNPAVAERQASPIDPGLVAAVQSAQAVPAAAVLDETGLWPEKAALKSIERHEALGMLTPIEVENQKFERETFPPPGWQVIDAVAVQSGQDPQYTFSRELCDVRPLFGGLAAAWAVGGGAQGEQLPCGMPYGNSAAIQSWLVYTIDTRPYPAGLQVNMGFKVDQPAPEHFVVCATTDDEGNVWCYQLNGTTTPWTSFRDMLSFPDAGNQEQAHVIIAYRDPVPPAPGNAIGDSFGLFIDNVVVMGLPEEVPPTTQVPPTSGTPATPPPPRATTTPYVGAFLAYLPSLGNAALRADIKDPKALPPTGVEVVFGQEVDAATGKVKAAGSAFQYGVMQLCARVRWWGQPAGMDLRWRWYKDGTQVDVAALNGDITVSQADGFEFRCIVGPLDEFNRHQPVMLGEYEVRAYVGGSSTADAIGKARVQAEPPPGKTPIVPTETPSESPTPGGPPTREPTPEGCMEMLENRSFEDGPTVWQFASTVAGKQITDVIREAAPLRVRAMHGDWIAAMGNVLDSEDQLSQPSSPTGLFPPEEIERAELAYWGAMISQETDDGQHDDWLVPFFVNPAGVATAVPESGLTEENTQSDRWYRVSGLDVTELMTKREGWPSSRLLFAALNDEKDTTVALLDDVSLLVCPKALAPYRLSSFFSGRALEVLMPRGFVDSVKEARPQAAKPVAAKAVAVPGRRVPTLEELNLSP